MSGAVGVDEEEYVVILVLSVSSLITAHGSLLYPVIGVGVAVHGGDPGKFKVYTLNLNLNHRRHNRIDRSTAPGFRRYSHANQLLKFGDQ